MSENKQMMEQKLEEIASKVGEQEKQKMMEVAETDEALNEKEEKQPEDNQLSRECYLISDPIIKKRDKNKPPPNIENVKL